MGAGSVFDVQKEKTERGAGKRHNSQGPIYGKYLVVVVVRRNCFLPSCQMSLFAGNFHRIWHFSTKRTKKLEGKIRAQLIGNTRV